MKKLILKTAIVTFVVTVILAVAAFGVASFIAPATMMRFTASLGLESVSGDYAYQEYERSGDLSYLARAFLIAAEKDSDKKANERFDVLYGEEGSERREAFSAFCAEYTVDDSSLPESARGLQYRMYLCGKAAVVKYRLAQSAETKGAVCDFAVSETDKAFPAGNPVVALAICAASSEDGAFCALLLEKISAAGFDQSGEYNDIVTILEDVK